jgi:CubicO group peptidase (beta-lactamase class C family)
VFSTTKGATAACANLLAQQGRLDIDEPVAAYWPGFARAGKERIPVRWLLCHKAGLPTIDRRLTIDEALAWEPVIDALEAQFPLWEPGTAHGYHAYTFGHLVGEVVRRIDGRSLGAFFRQEIAEPLGLEFWIGLPEEQEHRVAPLHGALLDEPSDPAAAAAFQSFLGPETLLGRALTLNGAFVGRGYANTRAFRAAEIPAANGVTNARSLSRFYAGLVGVVDDGPDVPLLTRPQVDRARERQTVGADRVLSFPGLLDVDSTIGLGFWTSSPFAPFGGVGAFGHAGAGGSVGFADPENLIAGGYVMNRMLPGLTGDPRSRALIGASYECVGAPATFV